MNVCELGLFLYPIALRTSLLVLYVALMATPRTMRSEEMVQIRHIMVTA